MRRLPRCLLTLTFLSLLGVSVHAEDSGDLQRLVAAILGETPLIEDLQALTDEIGGRPTGSEANLRSVQWALQRFRQAGVEARKEAFDMPALWLERSASAEIRGDARFPVSVAAMPFSTATPATGLTAPLVNGGTGSKEDFARLGSSAIGAFVLIESEELLDVAGLFEEYANAAEVEPRAFAAGVAGVVYLASRPSGVLYRHNASQGPKNDRPMLVVERDAGLRALRLLRSGKRLELWVRLELETGGPYESYNVVGEIRGRQQPEEIIVVGAHLDSWGLGTGALDNGCNVALVIDMARQIRRLGLEPRRTIRFALFNGEEQGLHGSWGYTKTHGNELDRHVMASSYDIGSGRISGYFTNGRTEIIDELEQALVPVGGLGPFTNINQPIVGTDNYDFMMQGVANLVANQESDNYGPNYHARSDTFDKVDQRQLRINAAIAAAVTWAFADMDVDWRRQSRSEIEELVATTDLESQMRMFGLWEPWLSGERGRQIP